MSDGAIPSYEEMLWVVLDTVRASEPIIRGIRGIAMNIADRCDEETRKSVASIVDFCNAWLAINDAALGASKNEALRPPLLHEFATTKEVIH